VDDRTKTKEEKIIWRKLQTPKINNQAHPLFQLSKKFNIIEYVYIAKGAIGCYYNG
jgi:hypothetical protein